MFLSCGSHCCSGCPQVSTLVVVVAEEVLEMAAEHSALDSDETTMTMKEEAGVAVVVPLATVSVVIAVVIVAVIVKIGLRGERKAAVVVELV